MDNVLIVNYSDKTISISSCYAIKAPVNSLSLTDYFYLPFTEFGYIYLCHTFRD